VDHPGRLRRRLTNVDRPGAYFFFSGRKVGLQPEQPIRGAYQGADAAFLDPKLFQKCIGFFRRQIDEIALNLRADDHRFTREVLANVRTHFADIRVCVGGCKVRLFEVAGEDRGLVGEQKELSGKHPLVGRKRDCERGTAAVETLLELREHRFFGGCTLLAAFHIFSDALFPFRDAFEVGEHELRVDDLDVANRIDGPRHVMNVRVVKTPDHLDNRVYFPDVRQKLVAEALSCACPFHQTRNVDKLDRRRNDDGGFGDTAQGLETGIRNDNRSDIRVDRAKGIIRRLSVPGACDGVEKCGLSDVGQTDDSGSKHA
jgi:hypothetical protein